jgi:hypothetical protein
MRARWTALSLILPGIAVLAMACDRTTPTEVQRPSARGALPTFDYDDDDDNNDGLTAHPVVFVGREGDCGPGYPAGHNIVTSAWHGGMGLPDNGDPHPDYGDPHLGLLLNKNGPTADCSAPGARITGVKGLMVDADFALGFDYREGGHCTGGAPRFNVFTKTPDGTEVFHFVGGCGNAAPLPAEQDDANWTRVRFPAAAWIPPAAPGSRIMSISIIHDEGTDAISAHGTSMEPSGIGLAVIDNIFVDGRLIRRGRSFAEGRANGENRDHDNDGVSNELDDDDDNDTIPDVLDIDADGDGITDALAIKLMLPRLPGLGLPDLR